MTNAQLFVTKFKANGLEAALRAIGVDPNAERIMKLRLTRMSDEGRAIVSAVSVEYNIPSTFIVARSRRAELVTARTEVMRRMRALGWSYPRIGKELGRDHQVVMWALGATEKMRAKRAAACEAKALKAVG